jgi:peptidyl-prolyl cis-trans isomerase C/peptidyl-prolyl cis-trans isomerase D
MYQWIFLGILFFQIDALAQVLAKVGNTEITVKEFEEKYEQLKKQLVEMPDKKSLLEDMINFEVGVQEAQKRGLEQDPLIRDRMKQELYKGFVEKELAPKTIKITANDSELKSYYAKSPEIRASQILIEVRSDATAEQKKEARKRAQEIYDSVRKSQRKFEELVKIYSDDPLSNKSGGDIGWQTRLTLYPSVYNQVSRLSVGQISPLIETPFGFFIVKLTGKKSFADADHAMLRLAVQEEKKKKLYDQFIAGIRAKYKVQINKNP